MNVMRRGLATHASKTHGINGVLDHALKLVPKLGWQDAVTEATREQGLSDQAASIFRHGGALDLILYHHSVEKNKLSKINLKEIPVGIERVNKLMEHRLITGNDQIGQHNLAQSIQLLLRPGNLTDATNSMEQLVDEIWFLAGDRSTDTTWYTRRASLAALYAAAEVVQSRDHSRHQRDTKAFVSNQLARWNNIEYAEKSVGEWLSFNAQSALNLARTYL